MRLIELSIKNIINRKFRTFLHIFVVTFAVCVLVMTYSLSENITMTAHREILDKSILNEIVVSAFEVGELLTYNDLLIVGEVRNVDYITPQKSMFVGIETNSEEINSNVIAVSAEGINYKTISDFIISTYKTDEECCYVPQVFIVNDTVYSGEVLLGSEITFEYTIESGRNRGEIKTFSRRVGGVYDASNLELAANTIFFDELDINKIVASAHKMPMQKYIGSDKFMVMKVYVKDDTTIELTKEEIIKLGYQATDINDSQNNIPGIVKYILWIGAGISLIVMFLACSSIASMILNTVNSRKREIGILKAIGLRNNHVRRVFFYEIIIICVVSIIVGLCGAQLILVLINNRIEYLFSVEVTHMISIKGGFLGGIMGMVIPIIFVAIPIYKAGNLEPITTMRED